MKKSLYVSASTLCVDVFSQIEEYAKSLQGLVDFIHCDVADGHFVATKTYDHNLVASLNQSTITMLDVHLMCDNPAQIVDDYIEAGANILSVHYEAFQDKELLSNTLKKIKENEVLAGLAINPETTLKEVKMFCYNIDVLLVMAVVPGASGQKFIPFVLDKIKEINAFRKENKLKFKIEVDGGITPELCPALIEAGADMVVSGNFIYKADNREEAVRALKGA